MPFFAYPTSCAAEAAFLFKTLTGAEPLNVPMSLQAGWTVQGWAQAQFVPLPEVQAAWTLTDDDGLAALAYLGSLEGSEVKAKGILDRLLPGAGASPAAGTGAGGVLIQLLLPLLMRWLQEWVKSGGLEEFIKRLLGGTAPAG